MYYFYFYCYFLWVVDEYANIALKDAIFQFVYRSMRNVTKEDLCFDMEILGEYQ